MIDLIYEYEAAIRMGLFITGFALLASWERLRPRRELSQAWRKRWINNFALVVSGTLLVRFILPTAAIGVAYLAEQNHWGLVHHIELPFWQEVLITFVFLDLSIYIQHAMFHVIPVLWRFHRVHHSDMDCDITTGLRFHPVEILLSIIIKIVSIALLGAPVLAVILFEVVLNLMSMFTHSNISMNPVFERAMRWILVTPDMHRIHHSVRENETNSNFAFHLSLWDRLFGTYLAAPAAGQQGMRIGLDQFRETDWQTFRGLLYMPFVTGVRGYAINYRDTSNEDELMLVRQQAQQNQEMATLATELASYLEAIGQHALVSATDPAGRIIQVNDKFCEVSGYSREELLGQNHRIVNSGVHGKAFFVDMWATITSGRKWHGEICNRAKNGALYWVDSAIVPVMGLSGKIERYISVRLDITERKQREAETARAYAELAIANSRLDQLSRVDALTEVANRRHFDEALLNEINTHSRTNTPLALILCDIDYFKHYNDTYGHPAGDACLQQVARTIADSFSRKGDLVARYGGEEFAIILPNVDQQTALAMAERMRLAVEELALEHTASSLAGVVTVSAGVTSLLPDKDTRMAEIIEKADMALYKAKERGRNQTVYLA